MSCPLCVASNEEVLLQTEKLRVIAVHNEATPAFRRVIWQAHVAEMTDLSASERHWHVIARFQADAHFPAPIWANAQREAQLALPVDWVQQVQAILLR